MKKERSIADMEARILLAEDDNDLRDMIARTLRKANYVVDEAADGQQALDLLVGSDDDDDENTMPYDVVLTDIVMGEIDGIEVLNIARSLPNPPEVILLTGHGSLETAIEAVRNQAFDYLLKPSPKNKLLERVEAAIEHCKHTQKQHKAVEIVHKLADFASSTPSTQQTPSTRDASFQSLQSGERYLDVGALRIDTHRQEVFFEHAQIHVTPTEYLILAHLALIPGRVLTFGDIIRRTHHADISDEEAHNLLRSHVRNLRKKIDRRYIVSVYATGYMVVEPSKEHPPS